MAILIVALLTLAGCFFSGAERQRWTLAPEGTTSFSLSREGRFALYYSAQQGIVLWDLQQNKKLADFGSQDPYHNTVLTSRISDNNRFAITATAQNFAVWDLAWGHSDGLWSISDGQILDVAIGNNGQHVLLALSNGKALYVDLGSGRRLEFLAHREKVNAVAISPNGRYALSGGNDHYAYLWDTRDGQILFRFDHTSRVRTVALQRDGKLAFTADGHKGAYIWDLSNGKKQATLAVRARQQTFSSARFADDGLTLATGTPARRVETWDTRTGENLGRWETAAQQDTRPPAAVVYDVAITPEGQITSGTSAGIAQQWTTE
ncbi:WD40 repeat domain-containing protein [Photobacterium aphoticum]|nr:WD40 repeat domain-containing protein [Photobacterium aphoticum]GHA44489.1 vegetatible incompatibility protein HET-E-1 [Photobacterium aphoticum]